MRRTLSILVIFFCCLSRVDAQDPWQILSGVNSKFRRVNSYQADVRIRTEISFIKILPVRAEIYYKKPDQFRIKSKGIAILPRQGFGDILKTLADTASYTALYQGQDKIGELPVQIVNIIPNADTSDMVLGKFWVDQSRNLILKSQITTKTNGTVQAEYFFGNLAAWALPDSMVFTVDTKKFKIPKMVAADINNYNASAKEAGKKSSKGKIYMSFTNYIINKSLPDAIFNKTQ